MHDDFLPENHATFKIISIFISLRFIRINTVWWIFTHNACVHMPTIDPIHMRIVDHALRMIGTFLGPGDILRIPKIN